MSVPPAAVPPLWGEQFRGLGLTCDIVTAARILGIGRTTAFDLLRRGKFPVEVIALGRVRRIRTADLLAYLRVPVPDQAGPDGSPGPPSSPTPAPRDAGSHQP